MAHRDRVGGSSGRRKGAGDAVHPPSAAAAPLLRRTGRQNFSTPSDGPPTRPERRLTKAFGRRRPPFAMPRIATAHAPSGLHQLKCTHTIGFPVSSAGGEVPAMRGHRQAFPTPRGDGTSDPKGGVARPPDVVARRL